MGSRSGVKGIAGPLLAWYRKERRDLPWRRSADPYRVWVSEIMLQQTRAQAAIPYYERFLGRFPSVETLAAAKEEEVLALWSGLGYYSRARNLWKAARAVAERGFPRDLESWRALPGVGDYTAAAVASIAFSLPHAAVDGNVLRVAARVENDSADIGSARTRGRFRTIVEGWLDRRNPGAFNQAMMELGATVCLPKSPRCGACPLAPRCGARHAGTAAQLPIKLRRVQAVRIEETLLLIRRRGRVLLWREEAGARRLAGMWRLPGVVDLPEARIGRLIGEVRHTITHHHYRFAVHEATADGRTRPPSAWFAPGELSGIPLVAAARKALELGEMI